MPDPKTLKFQLMFTAADLARVDEFRWKNRIGSRAAAIRRLIDEALLQNKRGAASAATDPRPVTNPNL